MSRTNLAEPVSILRAEIGRAGDLARLHSGLFDTAWDAASFAQLLADPCTVAFVAHGEARHAGEAPALAGFIVGRVAADEVEILTVGVARDRQRLGIGRGLVEALALAAGERGARHLHLEVAAGNAAARALYDRLGFAEKGRRRGYYKRADAPAEDALNLSLPIERFTARHCGGRLGEPHL